MVQRTLLNLLRLLGTEHRWCEDPIESAPFIIRDRAPMVQRTLLNLLRLLLLGTEHRWCEDPIESAPFIRDRAPMVQRTLLNLLRLLLLLLLFFFFSKLNRILEGLNMLEKSGNFAHASELVKIYV